MNNAISGIRGVYASLIISLFVLPGPALPAEKLDPALADMKKEILEQKVTALEALAKERPFSVAETLKMAELYTTLNQTGKLYSVATKLSETFLSANPTSYPAAMQYRAAVVLRDAGKIDEMEKVLDICIKRMPKDAPENVYLEMAKMYGLAKKPARTAEMLNRFLLRDPKVWQVWIELAVTQVGLGQEKDALFSLERAMKLDEANTSMAVNANPYLSKLWQKEHKDKPAAPVAVDPAKK